MNVYVLTALYLGDEHTAVLGVFKTPKAARKFLDERRGINTKGKWKKSKDQGLRFHITPRVEYTIKEWMLS